MKFTLTKKKPTEPGWYWTRYADRPKNVRMRRVEASGFGLVMECSRGMLTNISQIKAEWSQRIPEPMEEV